jgi:hypothetical protein
MVAVNACFSSMTCRYVPPTDDPPDATLDCRVSKVEPNIGIVVMVVEESNGGMITSGCVVITAGCVATELAADGCPVTTPNELVCVKKVV